MKKTISRRAFGTGLSALLATAVVPQALAQPSSKQARDLDRAQCPRRCD